MRVLIVDDERPILAALERFFERRGDQVRQAGSGEDAVKILEGYCPDLVVTDFRMPGMNGVELLRIVAMRYPRARRVLLSGYADYEGPLDAAFIQKPYEQSELVALCQP